MAKKEKTKFITPDILKTSVIGAFQTGSKIYDQKSGNVCC